MNIYSRVGGNWSSSSSIDTIGSECTTVTGEDGQGWIKWLKLFFFLSFALDFTPKVRRGALNTRDLLLRRSIDNAQIFNERTSSTRGTFGSASRLSLNLDDLNEEVILFERKHTLSSFDLLRIWILLTRIESWVNSDHLS